MPDSITDAEILKALGIKRDFAEGFAVAMQSERLHECHQAPGREPIAQEHHDLVYIVVFERLRQNSYEKQKRRPTHYRRLKDGLLGGAKPQANNE